MNIRGAAGTGKTVTLRVLQNAILESGHEVMAVAPTMSAVGELQKEGFKDAVTAHRSQGKSVDEVIIFGDGMRKELFYVAASRGREGLHIITSDKELLRESVGLSSARQSASELERRNRPGLHQGLRRGSEP